MRHFVEEKVVRPLRLTKSSTSRFAVTREHAACLATMLDRPMRYQQRCLEQLSFLPTGGQQWVRTLQTQIPKTATPLGAQWRIVSLGEYKRQRFPDFTVTDAQGLRLDRLTRRQHGIALTKAILATHFFSLPKKQLRHSLKKENTKQAYVQLRDALHESFTAVGEITSRAEREKIVTDRTHLFIQLLTSVDVPRETPEQDKYFTERYNNFAQDFADELGVIQYLCWVRAAPGEILNLQVSRTNRDRLGMLIGRGRLLPALKTIWNGILGRGKEKRRKARMRWYCQFGLAPLSYEFPVPVAHSYYFTMEPPAKTDVTYLDWEIRNTFEDNDELNSALASAHLHNRDTAQRHVQNRAIRAYVRCRAREHKQIAFGAFLNLVFVLLAARGRFTSSVGTSAQTWLLVTPTILIAYLAEQQRHYYAHSTRRHRAVLWIYLAISIAFLITLSFSLSHGMVGSQGWGIFARLVAWIFAASSVFICVWYTPLGYNYQLSTEKKTKLRFQNRGKKKVRLKIGKWNLCSTGDDRQTWEVYEDVIRKYCDRVLGAAVVISLCASAAIILTWHYPPLHKPVTKKQAASHLVQPGTLTLTTWPSPDCKGCNLELRFVPTNKSNK
jgi:hypothetical protein